MSRQANARRQRQPLRWLVHRHISRLLQNMDALEVLPHRVRGISNAARSECVGGQKIAEFVGDQRLADRQKRRKSSAAAQRQDAYRHYGESPPPRHLAQPLLCRDKPTPAKVRIGPRKSVGQ